MYNTLGFYNYYGNGDIFESREFIREIMELNPAKEYIYYTGKSHRLLMDIPNLTVIDAGVPLVLDNGKAFIKDNINNNLFINTWIGRNGSYLYPGYACTVEGLHRMYNDILAQTIGTSLTKQPIDYLTSFNYNLYDINEIDKYMLKNDGIFVYISNGSVHSGQAVNFDMQPLIEKLASIYKDITFFVTQNFETSHKNIIDANKFTTSGMASNFVELSYLSTFCDVIIGRNSGPQVFTWTKENCFSDKVNITFTINENCKHFVHHSPISMKQYWNGSTDVEHLVEVIKVIFGKDL